MFCIHSCAYVRLLQYIGKGKKQSFKVHKLTMLLLDNTYNISYTVPCIRFHARIHEDIFTAENVMSAKPLGKGDITFSAVIISSCTLQETVQQI